MSRIVTSRTVGAAEVDAVVDDLCRPRDDIVVERETGAGRFEAARGPFSAYTRSVTTAPAGDGTGATSDSDGLVVTQAIEFRLAIPFWWWLFVLPVRRTLRHPPRHDRPPWWAPPDVLDARASTVLGLLCTIAVVGGYLGTLITQTITYTASDFGVGRTGQGATLAAVRAGVLVTFVVASLADRRGRRKLLVVAAAGSCLLTATGALAPNMVWLGISQTAARGLASALLVLVAIVSAEEMPSGARAYAFSLITMTGALGAGACLWALPLADMGDGGWRALYVLPLLGLPIVAFVARRLPESRRFAHEHVEAPMSGHGRRLWLLAISGFLLATYAAPASQFQNDFLRDERGFSAARVALFVLATSTPGGIGIIVGGRLAEIRGRRTVGAVGIVGGTVGTAIAFAAEGWPMWVASIAGAMVAGLLVPALGVYRPELFPTSLRGRAAGLVEVISLAGSALGLLVVGQLADRWDSYARPMALVAAAPLVVAGLVVTIYPETAKRSLEELNPEDAPMAEQ